MTAILLNYIVPTIHILACIFLIVVVLLQTGKGADMGAVFGGGSQTLFGSGGAGNFLTKLTTGTAIAFMLTSLILTYGASRTPTSRLIDRLPAPSAEAPAEEPTAAADDEAPAAADEAAAPDAEGEAPAAAPEAQDAPAEEPAPAP
jgi:preprotein translocase subunit SecG